MNILSVDLKIKLMIYRELTLIIVQIWRDLISNFSRSFVEHWCYRFDEADLVVLKIKDGIVILQKLRAHHPVLLSLFSAQALELPRLDKQEVVCRVLGRTFDVGVVRHLYDGGFILRRNTDHIEFNIWNYRSVWVTFAIPKWLALLTLKAHLTQIFYQLNKRLFWNHGQTHAIVKYYLLAIIGKFIRTIVNANWIDCPVIGIVRLLEPEKRCIFLRKLFKIVATEGNISRTFPVIGQVYAKYLIICIVVILVLLQLGYEPWDPILQWICQFWFLGGRRRQTYEPRALQALKVDSIDNRQKINRAHTRLFVATKTALIQRRMPCNGTFPIL